ncbi:queuosine 5'-phosphate N-glycosylase/hydrolase-like [Oscarella lobularis]|uniref:queuosine 5'-phosphate N-glycosylase/hydrolase-like n=1 Tax=Oscarella lobularis TaxID=121494 RepID=UPI0033140D47
MSKESCLSPVESGQYIAANSDHIRISKEAVTKTAGQIYGGVDQKEYAASWRNRAVQPEETPEWIFLIDLLNFSFWSPDPSTEFAVEYDGAVYTDYFALCAVVKRAHKEGLKLTHPDVQSRLTYEEFAHAFRSATAQPIPLLKERYELVREAGQTMIKLYDGSFANCVKKCERSAQKLISVVVRDFPSFRDEAEFKGQKVSFYKRAQILVADLWACFEGQGLGEFRDIETLTAFADYRVPQILRYFGILLYDETLEETLEKGTVMSSGDPLEVEIRGCTIWAVELIKKEFMKTDINSMLVDFYLWNAATDMLTDSTPGNPAHKTRSFYY